MVLSECRQKRTVICAVLNPHQLMCLFADVLQLLLGLHAGYVRFCIPRVNHVLQ